MLRVFHRQTGELKSKGWSALDQNLRPWDDGTLHQIVWYFMIFTELIDTVDVILGDWHDTGAGLTENCLGWICIGTL